jgi:hypothetical protein
MARSHPHVHTESVPSRAERAAVFLSLLCAVHCLLLPVAMAVLPLLGVGGLLFSEGTELALGAFVVISALLGLAWGYRRHRDARFVLATLTGLALYLVGHGFEHSWLGLLLSVIGALSLAASSFLGMRAAHHCEDEHCAAPHRCVDAACSH